jgi:putative transposase
MIDKTRTLPVTTQCRLLGLNRSTAYYQPVPTPDADLALMRRIDRIHMRYPFMGSRRIPDELELDDVETDSGRINRKRVQRLMRVMGIQAVHPKPKTSVPGKAHRIYPYQLRGLTIERPKQVYAADITYIPMAKGFLYLVAVIDWYSRRVLSWRLSNSMDSGFCVEALSEALSVHGAPEIFNTDQGAQFTSEAFTGVLKEHNVTISMDGKGRWLDNVFVERLWRSLKYEEVYLKAYESVDEARREIGSYLTFFNGRRRHSSLGRRTPDAVFFNCDLLAKAA